MTPHMLARRITPLLLMLAMLIAGCADDQIPTEPAPAGKATVSGLITDESDLIVPYAAVEALNGAGSRIAIDTTDETGAFTLTGLPEDMSALSVRVSHENFKTFTGPLAAAGGSGAGAGRLLRVVHEDSCCARIVVNVTDRASGAPLRGVEVRLRRAGRLVTVTTTDSSGRATFSNVCRGEFDLRLSRSGFRVEERGDILITGCDTASIGMSMSQGGSSGGGDTCCGGVLRIVPRDSSNGSVITGASVRITRNGAQRTETSGGDGVTFREICPGTYNVRIAREGTPGYRVLEFSVTVGCNDSATIDRTLTRLPVGGDSCCRGMIILGLRDSSTDGTINGASVRLWRGSTLVTTRTSENGRVVFTGLCPGSYGISMSREGYAGREFDLTIGCNDTIERGVRMLGTATGGDTCRTAVLRMRVKDSTVAERGWLSGATVTISRGGVTVATGTTGAEGWYVREGLTGRSTYTVTFSKDGYRSKSFPFTFEGCSTIQETIRLAPN